MSVDRPADGPTAIRRDGKARELFGQVQLEVHLVLPNQQLLYLYEVRFTFCHAQMWSNALPS